MVGTLLDLAGDGRQRVRPRVAFDLLVGGWTERAHRHVQAVGLVAASWRLAAGIAVVAQLAVSVVWLRDWALTGTPVVLPHMISNASAVTFGLALVGFVIGAVAWLAGQRLLARIAAGVAIISWVLTVGVFLALSNPLRIDWYEVVVWSYLAAFATVGMFQPSPTQRRLAGVIAILVLLAAQMLTTGVEPMTAAGTLVIADQQQLSVALLDRGADTLHTALRSGWTLLVLAGLALVRIDPRPVLAACWLLPFLALDHLYWGGPLGLTTGLLAGFAVIVWALVLSRSLKHNSGPDLTT